MKYKPLGKTDLRISELSFGGATLGNMYGAIEARQAIDAVRFAVDQGINFIDTSPYYGTTLSESRLGEALQDGYRQRIILATKAGRYHDGTATDNGFDFSYDRVLKSWEESARRLKTDFFELYQLHDVEFVRVEQIVNEAWPAMVRLKEEGKVGHIGITGYPLQHLARLATLLEPTAETILTYCRYNLMNTTFERWLLPVARELEIGIINASTTHMGILTERGAEAWHPAPPEVCKVGRAVYRHARARGESITDLALLFSLAHPYIATTCVGMRSVEEVRQNLEVLDNELDEELLEEIKELIAPVKDHNWMTGYPQYNDPGSVPATSSPGAKQ